MNLREECPLHFTGTLHWGNTTPTGVRLATDGYEFRMLQGIKMVPFIGDEVVLARDRKSYRLPGGTMERGESIIYTARREMMEETGCEIHTFHPAIIVTCHSYDAEPWRPWFVHPDYEHLIGVGQVVSVGEPSNPDDAEHMEAIEIMPVADALAVLTRHGRADLAETYRLAAKLWQAGTVCSDLAVDLPAARA